jgi:hypothetical protein
MLLLTPVVLNAPAADPCCRLQEGSKHIFHLEAFIARFMSNYKQASGWAGRRRCWQRLLGSSWRNAAGLQQVLPPAAPRPCAAAANRRPASLACLPGCSTSSTSDSEAHPALCNAGYWYTVQGGGRWQPGRGMQRPLPGLLQDCIALPIASSLPGVCLMGTQLAM